LPIDAGTLQISKSVSLLEKKAEQVDRAERLLREIDPQKTYSYEFVCYKITGYRPESVGVVAISGAGFASGFASVH
jgi:hypothetical protein